MCRLSKLKKFNHVFRSGDRNANISGVLVLGRPNSSARWTYFCAVASLENYAIAYHSIERGA